MARQLSALERASNLVGPQNDDELHKLIKDRLGMDIPRQSVCDGHVAPFTFLADLYFERTLAAIAMANRGGAKTMMAAILHLLNSKFKKNCSSATVGAIEAQAFRAYDHLQGLICEDGKVDVPDEHPEISSSIMRKTRWKNGSDVEVLPGTKSAVNGPHPQKVHFDEVELADPEVFQESRNMSQSKAGIKAQDFITSTRKRAFGPMQTILDECNEALRLNLDPPYKQYVWCCYESAEQVKNCQVANPELPEGQRCECDRVVKGKWEDGRARTFKDACAGRLFRSRGWIPLSDLQKTFRLVSQDLWEAQQECSKPSTSGLVLPMFVRDRHCIRWWDPDPSLGPIYSSVDFGGTNPHAVEWIQVLRNDFDAWGYHQLKSDEPNKRLKAGTRVVFDEIYVAEIGNVALAKKVLNKEDSWRRKHPGFRAFRRFADVQAKAARLDWAHHEPPLGTVSYATKDIKEHVKIVRELVQDDQLVVDVGNVGMLTEEMESWHYPDKRGFSVDDPDIPVSDFDHGISAIRYGLANIRAIERAQKRSGTGPGVDEKTPLERKSRTGAGAARYLPREGVTW